VKIVLAGASGFLGTAWRDHLAREGHDLYILVSTRGEGGEVGEPPLEGNTIWLDAAGLHTAVARGRIGGHCRLIPFFRQCLARQHHVDRARWIAVGEGAGARQRLLHHHARG